MKQEFTQEEIRKLKEICKGKTIIEDNKWLPIPELKIEVELEEHDEGLTYEQAKKLETKDLKFLEPHEAMFLWANKKYRDKLNLDWFWVNAETTGFPAARFLADSGGAVLGCNRYPGGSDSGLGVRMKKVLK